MQSVLFYGSLATECTIVGNLTLRICPSISSPRSKCFVCLSGTYSFWLYSSFIAHESVNVHEHANVYMKFNTTVTYSYLLFQGSNYDLFKILKYKNKKLLKLPKNH